MKRFIKTALVLLCVALPTLYACSQPPVPPIVPPVAGPAGPGRTPLPPGGPEGPNSPGGRSVQQLISIQGTLKAYAASDSDQYDGLTLQNSGQTLVIRFAPHMAAQLMAAAKPGSSVRIEGFYETTPEGMNVIHLVSFTAGSETIFDGPPTAPANPPTETIQPFNGTIIDLRRDRQGTPTGIILSGSRVVELPPVSTISFRPI